MAPKTQRLRLNNPGSSDPFLISDLTENWDLLDAHPGVHICTSTTRPVWTAAQNGQLIYETDRALYWHWVWSGSSGTFVRLAAAGLLGQTLYTGASIVNSNTSSATTVASVTVTPKAGNRALRIDAGWYSIGTNSPNVAGNLWVQRGTTVLASYRSVPGMGGAITVYDLPDTTSAVTYSLRLVTTVNGTISTLVTGTNTPAFISVSEV